MSGLEKAVSHQIYYRKKSEQDLCLHHFVCKKEQVYLLFTRTEFQCCNTITKHPGRRHELMYLFCVM